MVMVDRAYKDIQMTNHNKLFNLTSHFGGLR